MFAAILAKADVNLGMLGVDICLWNSGISKAAVNTVTSSLAAALVIHGLSLRFGHIDQSKSRCIEVNAQTISMGKATGIQLEAESTISSLDRRDDL